MGSPGGRQMQYCPNCSAYQHVEGSERCPRCGFDIRGHLEQQKQNIEKDVRSKEISKAERLKEFDKDLSCPVCGSPSRMIDVNIDLEHEGKRIDIHGVKLMGGDITKKTATLYQMNVKGVECAEGHHFYLDVAARTKALCPLCTEPLHEYGSSLFSCTRCNRHFPMIDWEMPPPEAILKENGWYEAD